MISIGGRIFGNFFATTRHVYVVVYAESGKLAAGTSSGNAYTEMQN